MEILQGDCREQLLQLLERGVRVDAIVTDPPYEIGFMNKEFDKTGIAHDIEMWKLCLQILRPGGHLLSFGGTRTYHRMASAIEDAGFEIRDCIMWIFGQGFPKSLDIGKAIKQWAGWGSALKPAHEPIMLARKPLSEKTIAENVLRYGTGGLNIDGCRVEVSKEDSEAMERCNTPRSGRFHNGGVFSGHIYGNPGIAEVKKLNTAQGRFPSNLCHDGSEEVEAEFARQSKERGMHSAGQARDKWIVKEGYDATSFQIKGPHNVRRIGDTGSASRFFYCAKASKSERNRFLGEREMKATNDGREKSIDNPFQRGETLRHNSHPTVKPLALMKYLCRLITPTGGIVLDPFMGSGTTGMAAIEEGFDFIGIEKEAEYFEIAKARINGHCKEL